MLRSLPKRLRVARLPARLRVARLSLIVLLAACGAEAIPTVAEMPVEPRHPDGVVLEPSPAIPDASDLAFARGVVSLREPLSDEAVKKTVHAYFVAFVKEDRAAIERLLTADVVELGTQGRNGKEALSAEWKARVSALEYERLEGSTVEDLDNIERYRFDDLGGAGRDSRPPEMRQ
ncbi:MAG: hypothetical protein ABI183_07400, partial [Polyangiaceae bacterium]